MILQINTCLTVLNYLINHRRFGTVLIQKILQYFIAMLIEPFYNLLPFSGLLTLILMKVSGTVMVSFFVVRTYYK